MSKTGNGGAVGVGAAGAAQVAANSCEKGQIVSDADGQTSVLKRADARRAKPKTRFRQDISASMTARKVTVPRVAAIRTSQSLDL